MSALSLRPFFHAHLVSLQQPWRFYRGLRGCLSCEPGGLREKLLVHARYALRAEHLVQHWSGSSCRVDLVRNTLRIDSLRQYAF